jgi:dephospho-CoA kinase
MTRIYGVAGTFASGKDTLADWLEHNGFFHVSTSDIVRAGAKEKYGSIDRKFLFEYANEMRQQKGAGVLVDMALGMAVGNPEVAISGIRSVGEVESLKAAGGTLIFVDAPVTTRYERAYKRGRDEEVISLEAFKASEEKELNKPENSSKAEQNIGAVRDLADISLNNDTDLGTFFAEATAMIRMN